MLQRGKPQMAAAMTATAAVLVVALSSHHKQAPSSLTSNELVCFRRPPTDSELT